MTPSPATHVAVVCQVGKVNLGMRWAIGHPATPRPVPAHFAGVYRDDKADKWGVRCTCGTVHIPNLSYVEADRLARKHEGGLS